MCRDEARVVSLREGPRGTAVLGGLVAVEVEPCAEIGGGSTFRVVFCVWGPLLALGW